MAEKLITCECCGEEILPFYTGCPCCGLERPPSNLVPERYLTFLEQHAGDLPHSGRSLTEHLVGTHDLLQQWGNPEPVCLAGLFHSIYGTEIYQHRAVSIAQRTLIAGLIGSEAEKLAYAFSVTRRPKAFLANAGKESTVLYDHQTGGSVTITRDEMNKLLEIEAANLIEQGGNQHWLRQLLHTDISSAAKAAIRSCLSLIVAWAHNGD